MKPWIWPFSWYYELRALRLRVAVVEATNQKLTESNKQLQAEVISSGITLQGITSAYMAALQTQHEEIRSAMDAARKFRDLSL